MTAHEVLSKVRDLPAVSEAARKVPVLLNQPSLHQDELIEVLRRDATLTAKLLSVCNSALFGLREPVATVEQAVFLLGNNTIARMVCAMGVGSAMGFPMPAYAVEARGLWKHSLTTAMVAESVAQENYPGNFQPDMAFTAGLLHDIGKLVLSRALTGRTSAAKSAEIRLTNSDAEKVVFGTDHSEVGAVLLKTWKLPEVIVGAVADHHKPVAKPAHDLSAVVNIANSVAHLTASASSKDDLAAKTTPALAQSLALEQKDLEHIVRRTHELMPKVEEWMTVT